MGAGGVAAEHQPPDAARRPGPDPGARPRGPAAAGEPAGGHGGSQKPGEMGVDQRPGRVTLVGRAWASPRSSARGLQGSPNRLSRPATRRQLARLEPSQAALRGGRHLLPAHPGGETVGPARRAHPGFGGPPAAWTSARTASTSGTRLLLTRDVRRSVYNSSRAEGYGRGALCGPAWSDNIPAPTRSDAGGAGRRLPASCGSPLRAGARAHPAARVHPRARSSASQHLELP